MLDRRFLCLKPTLDMSSLVWAMPEISAGHHIQAHSLAFAGDDLRSMLVHRVCLNMVLCEADL